MVGWFRFNASSAGVKKEADEFQIKQDEQLHSENSHSGAILGRVS